MGALGPHKVVADYIGDEPADNFPPLLQFTYLDHTP
jgi:hypothetical protein